VRGGASLSAAGTWSDDGVYDIPTGVVNAPWDLGGVE
jgi:hypothetical protein